MNNRCDSKCASDMTLYESRFEMRLSWYKMKKVRIIEILPILAFESRFVVHLRRFHVRHGTAMNCIVYESSYIGIDSSVLKLFSRNIKTNVKKSKKEMSDQMFLGEIISQQLWRIPYIIK